MCRKLKVLILNLLDVRSVKKKGGNRMEFFEIESKKELLAATYKKVNSVAAAMCNVAVYGHNDSVKCGKTQSQVKATGALRTLK